MHQSFGIDSGFPKVSFVFIFKLNLLTTFKIYLCLKPLLLIKKCTTNLGFPVFFNVSAVLLLNAKVFLTMALKRISVIKNYVQCTSLKLNKQPVFPECPEAVLQTDCGSASEVVR